MGFFKGGKGRAVNPKNKKISRGGSFFLLTRIENCLRRVLEISENVRGLYALFQIFHMFPLT